MRRAQHAAGILAPLSNPPVHVPGLARSARYRLYSPAAQSRSQLETLASRLSSEALAMPSSSTPAAQ